MKIEMVLILAAIAVALADTKRSTNITSPKYNNMYRKTFIPVTIEERRKLPLLPKSATKFIVTQRPNTKKINGSLETKSLMLQTKAIVEASTESLISRGLKASRAPLLKPRRLTTQAPIQITTKVISTRPKAKYAMLEDKTSKPDSYSTETNEDKLTRQYSRFTIRRPTPYVQSKNKLAKPNKHNSAEEMEDAHRSEQGNEDFDGEPSQMVVKIVKNTVQDHKVNDKIKKENKENEEQVYSSEGIVESLENTKAFNEINGKKVAEKMFDDIVDEEYLLVRDQRNQADAGVAILLLNDVGEYTTEYMEEYTTEYMEEVEQPHDKSKRDVVEEENLTSTVSGFKFTGKDTNLHSHLTYNNIHA